MTEDEIITTLHNVAVEISYIDNIHIRVLFTLLFAKEFDVDYNLFRNIVDRERKAILYDYRRRVDNA